MGAQFTARTGYRDWKTHPGYSSPALLPLETVKSPIEKGLPGVLNDFLLVSNKRYLGLPPSQNYFTV